MRTWAQRLDEGLAVLSGLLSGERFSFDGDHFHVGEMRFLPAPERRVPIWVAGRWPNPRPFERAARWDGVVAEKVGGRMVTAADVAELVAFVARHREGESAARPFDVVIGGSTPGKTASGPMPRWPGTRQSGPHVVDGAGAPEPGHSPREHRPHRSRPPDQHLESPA